MDPTSIIFNETRLLSRTHNLKSCGYETKIDCILCTVPMYRRPGCSVAGKSDDTDGREANKRVAYCRDWNIRLGKLCKQTKMTNQSTT